MGIVNTITQVLPLTEFQKKKRELYNNLYWPILQKIIPPPNIPKKNMRFPSAAACREEAWACAHLHAALLPEFNLLTIVNDPENDPVNCRLTKDPVPSVMMVPSVCKTRW